MGANRFQSVAGKGHTFLWAHVSPPPTYKANGKKNNKLITKIKLDFDQLTEQAKR